MSYNAGPNSPNWKGGRSVRNAVVKCYAPNHPHANTRRQVPEHRLVVEKAMGKILRPSAKVHHNNGIRTDNSNGNLVACDSQAHHMLIHARKRIVESGGSPSIHKICSLCHALLLKSDFGICNSTWD